MLSISDANASASLVLRYYDSKNTAKDAVFAQLNVALQCDIQIDQIKQVCQVMLSLHSFSLQ
jgi:hypothetical protein